jgi:hypothetical protein
VQSLSAAQGSCITFEGMDVSEMVPESVHMRTVPMDSTGSVMENEQKI